MIVGRRHEILMDRVLSAGFGPGEGVYRAIVHTDFVVEMDGGRIARAPGTADDLAFFNALALFHGVGGKVGVTRQNAGSMVDVHRPAITA